MQPRRNRSLRENAAGGRRSGRRLRDLGVLPQRFPECRVGHEPRHRVGHCEKLDLRPLGLVGVDDTWSAFRLRRASETGAFPLMAGCLVGCPS
jgi:hypothetical protein